MYSNGMYSQSMMATTAIPAYAEQTVIIVPSTMGYQYRNQMLAMRRQLIEKNLKEKFPKMFVYIHSGIFILFGLAEIAFQIAMAAKQNHLWYIFNGVWVGIYHIFVASLCLYFCKIFILFFDSLT
jgi:hypothetical protein